MVKICQTGLPVLNFEIIPKKRIFRFLPKISAGHAWSWKFFFANFQVLGPLGCQGWVVIPQNVKKSKSLHPSAHGAQINFGDLTQYLNLWVGPSLPVEMWVMPVAVGLVSLHTHTHIILHIMGGSSLGTSNSFTCFFQPLQSADCVASHTPCFFYSVEFTGRL
jgi:hypothetical protein